MDGGVDLKMPRAASHLPFTSIQHCNGFIDTIKKPIFVHMFKQPHHSFAAD